MNTQKKEKIHRNSLLVLVSFLMSVCGSLRSDLLLFDFFAGNLHVFLPAAVRIL
jgi:hypothetical protein